MGISSAIDQINYAKKPVVSVVAVVEEKNSIDNGTCLRSFEAKDYTNKAKASPLSHLTPKRAHKCDKYWCPREAKYQLGNSYYCNGKLISHFREISKTCQEEGFELIEDLQQLDI